MEYKLYESHTLVNYYGSLHLLEYKDKHYICVFNEVSDSMDWIEIKPSFFKTCLRNKSFEMKRDYVIEEGQNDGYHYKYKHFIKSLRELNKQH